MGAAREEPHSGVNLNHKTAVVRNEAHFPELVHKHADS
jgi:hypothetical protein